MEGNALQLHNVQIERDVLGAMMMDVNIYSSLFDELTADMFYDGVTRTVYDVMCEMNKEGKIPELQEVAMRIEVKGCSITEFLTPALPSFTVVEQQITKLRDMERRRKLTSTCIKMQTIANDPSADVLEADRLWNEFKESDYQQDSIVSLKEATIELMNDIAIRNQSGKSSGMMTGLHIFDVRHGFHTGDLIIVAAETSQGKSTLATTIARNMGLQGIPSAYYSMEMSARQLTARIHSRDVMIASARMLYGSMTEKEQQLMYDRVAGISESPVYFDDKSKTSFRSICASIRRMVLKKGIKIAFIDYLQILANSSGENREQYIGDMARTLKNLAQEQDICIVALSQVSRDKDTHEPSLRRLRGSGQIEEAADMAILIYRPEVYGVMRYKNGYETKGTAKLIIAKNRNGGLGDEIVTFNGNLSYFSDYVQGEQQPEDKGDDMPF